MAKGVRIPTSTVKRAVKPARKTSVNTHNTSFVEALLRDAIVEEVPAGKPAKMFPLFFISKPDGKARGIVDMSQLSKKLPREKFGLPTARKVMTRTSGRP